MSSSFAVEALWDGITRDQEAELRHELMVRGKVAVATYWPFLAVAESREEFDHRYALQAERIVSVLDPRVAQQVVDSLAVDWEAVHTARLADRQSQLRATAAAQPPGLRPGQEFFHAGSQRWMVAVRGTDGQLVAVEPRRAVFGGSGFGVESAIDPSDAQRYSTYPDLNPPVSNGPLQGPDGFVVDPDSDNTGMSNEVMQQRQLTPGPWTVNPGSEWPVRPNAGEPGSAPRTAGYSHDDLYAIQRRDPDGDENRTSAPTQADYDNHRDWATRTYGNEAWDRYRRGNWMRGEGDSHFGSRVQSVLIPGPQLKPHQRAHVLRAFPYRWTHENGAAEYNHGGPDRAPTVPKVSDDEWVNAHAFHFIQDGSRLHGGHQHAEPYSGETGQEPDAAVHPPAGGAYTSRRTAGEGVVPTPGPNPNYFSQGTQGLEGAPSYPEDPGPEPHEVAPLNMGVYAPAPMMSSGTDGSQNGPYSLGNPSATATIAGLIHVGEYHYVKKQGDQWVILQKGTGKVLSHHDSESEAQASFRAMEQSKHSSLGPRNFPERTASGPMFSPGDRVESFRGEGATVHRVIPSNESGKSHRVQVKWDEPARNLAWNGEQHPQGAGDERAYYENVFHHHPESDLSRSVNDAFPGSADQYQRAYSMRAIAFTDDHIAKYIAWAHSEGHDPDHPKTLKRYEQQPGIGRAHTNHIADQLYIGGGDHDWRQHTSAAGSANRHTASVGLLHGMRSGDSHEVMGHSVSYDAQQALGDNNQPAKGFTVGGYLVEHPEGGTHYFHHSPYNPDESWSASAKRYAAEKAMDYIRRSARKTASRGDHSGDALWAYDKGYEHGSAGHEPDLSSVDEEDERGHSYPARPETAHGYMDGHTMGRNWLDHGQRVASTDGRIVGHCDHCGEPVRVHQGDGGPTHLRHLHNNSNKCSDGMQASAGTRSQFFDPGDPSVRVVATLDDPGNMTDMPSLGTNPAGEGFDDDSNVPQASDANNPSVMSMRRMADGIERPTTDNPTGRGEDEFRATHWDSGVRQRPMQSAEERNINTPVLPNSPIKTLDTNNREQDHDDDEDENQNDQSRVASTSLSQIMEAV